MKLCLFLGGAREVTPSLRPVYIHQAISLLAHEPLMNVRLRSLRSAEWRWKLQTSQSSTVNTMKRDVS